MDMRVGYPFDEHEEGNLVNDKSNWSLSMKK